MRKVATVLGMVVGVFFIIRAVVELVTIDYSDPASYANDWGGPSLGGVLVVHCGLGLVSAIAIGVFAWRRLHLGQSPDAQSSVPRGSPPISSSSIGGRGLGTSVPPRSDVPT